MSPDTLQIRLPVAKTPDVTAAPTFTLDRPIEGTTIGIRHEGSWRSWMLIAGEWERFLERDGAKPVIVQTGERVGHEGEETRARVREWADSVDWGPWSPCTATASSRPTSRAKSPGSSPCAPRPRAGMAMPTRWRRS